MGEAIQPFYRQRYGLAKHSTAREIRSVVGELTWKRSYTFAFVRNPYTRAHSAFTFMKRVREERTLPVLEALDQLETFSDFVKSDFFGSEGMDRLLMPQMFWLRGDQRQPYPILDYVGRVENIAESFQTIADAVPAARRFLSVQDVPRLNRSDTTQTDAQDWMQCLTEPELEAKVYERYKVDFEAFGYSRFTRADLT